MGISPRLYAQGADRLGDLAAWGGRSMIDDKDFKAKRPLFGNPGVRTPMHVDLIPQILAQYNGTKYLFLGMGFKPKFLLQLERKLGYLGRDEVLEARKNSNADFAAGCVLRPG